MMGLDFVIRYNVERGYEDQALALARRLFAVYDEEIASLALVPDDDDFTLYFAGAILVSQRRDGRPPTVADVRKLLAARAATSELNADAT